MTGLLPVVNHASQVNAVLPTELLGLPQDNVIRTSVNLHSDINVLYSVESVTVFFDTNKAATNYYIYYIFYVIYSYTIYPYIVYIITKITM